MTNIRNSINRELSPDLQPLQNSLSEVELEPEIKILFISDQDINKKITSTFQNFNKRIVQFCSKTFINQSIEDLYKKNINMLWLNLRNKTCLQWTEKNIKKAKNEDWKIILITNKSSHLWVTDLKPYINEIVNIKKLQKWLISLSFEDFIDNIDEVHISKVPWKYLCCLNKK